MKYILGTAIFICVTLIMFLLNSCSQIPGLVTALDDAVTDEACQVTIDKAAMQPNTDIDIAVKITHQSTVTPSPTIHVHTNQEPAK